MLGIALCKAFPPARWQATRYMYNVKHGHNMSVSVCLGMYADIHARTYILACSEAGVLGLVDVWRLGVGAEPFSAPANRMCRLMKEVT